MGHFRERGESLFFLSVVYPISNFRSVFQISIGLFTNILRSRFLVPILTKFFSFCSFIAPHNALQRGDDTPHLYPFIGDGVDRSSPRTGASTTSCSQLQGISSYQRTRQSRNVKSTAQTTQEMSPNVYNQTFFFCTSHSPQWLRNDSQRSCDLSATHRVTHLNSARYELLESCF